MEVAQADDLLEEVRGLQRRAYAILDAAEETGELRTALAAIREARGNLELLAKLLGELDERPVINLITSPEWIELRAVIVTALEPHPGARESVLQAIEMVDNQFGYNRILGTQRQRLGLRVVAGGVDLERLMAWYSR